MDDIQAIQTQEVVLSPKDMPEIYREFGIELPTQMAQKGLLTKIKTQERYVRTITLPWVLRACTLKGKALHVGIVLWYFSGLTKSPTVKLTRARLKQFSIYPETGRRALRTLEEARLVTVERKGYRSPVVTLLTAFNDSGAPMGL